MRVLTMSLIMITNLIFESTIFQYIKIFGVKPNSAILIIVCYAILRGDIEGSIVGFFAGLLQDMFFGYYLGFYALLFALIGYVCGKPFKDFFHENYLLPVGLVFASVLSFNLIFYFFNFLFIGKTQFDFYFYKIILPETIYTTVLSFFVYKLIYKVNIKLEFREKKSEMMFK